MKRPRDFWRTGDPFVWLTGGGLALALLLVAGLVLLILVQGLGFCWPGDLVRFTLSGGGEVLGREVDRETGPAAVERVKVKQANRDLLGNDFVWLDETGIAARERPLDAAVIERREWGDFHGFVAEVRDGDRCVATGEEAWAELQRRIPAAHRVLAAIHAVEVGPVGDLDREQESIRLELRRFELAGTTAGPEVERLRAAAAGVEERYARETARIAELRASLTATVRLAAAGGGGKELPVAQVVRAYRPNGMGTLARLGFYVAKLWEFVSEDPRESNTEGGIFPAIFGTVMMVLIMTVVVTPFGVLAALFLREYARQGTLVSIVRIAVNNLAGVPSIVFGVFAVGFFIYGIGGAIDRAFFPEALPAPTFGTGGILWASLTLALLTLPVVIVATEEGLATIPPGLREASLALGATRLETVRRVVLPSVLPSILTGMILAISRAAGEVAPLMITGVVKLAPTLPIDGRFPWLHLDRKFMHLGFHIYDVGFQSPNVDAAQPMVFATALLLLLIVLALNLGAIVLRKRLRARLTSSAV